MAARNGKVVLLEMLWECAKWLQLKSEGLRSEVMSKTSMDKRPGTSQQADFTLNYYRKRKEVFFFQRQFWTNYLPHGNVK